VPQQRVAGVDQQLLAGLGVLDQDHAQIGQVELGRIDHPDHDDLVAVGEQRQWPFPGRVGDEVGQHEHEAAAAGRGGGRQAQHRGQVGGRPAGGLSRRAHQLTGDPEDLVAARPGRDHLVCKVVVEDGTDPVSE
jgi:hypothetical protein